MSQSRPSPVYLNSGSTAMFGVLHLPSSSCWRDEAVLMCPPFGWDDVCSYRSRREWSEHLARAGYPSLRIHLPSCGDSLGSPRDPDRLKAWVKATGDAASWLRSQTSARRIAAIGIGLSGLVLAGALAEGAPIDDVILWATPARGRTLVRELKTFSALEASGVATSRARANAARANGREPELADEGELEAGGFLMTAETLASLEGLDLSKLSFPEASQRRALLLDRDGIPVDRRLQDHLKSAGLQVTLAAGAGYVAMMAEPQDALPPLEVFHRVAAWLEETSRSVAVDTLRPSETDKVAEIELEVHGVFIREVPLFVEQPFGELFGILCEPADRSRASMCAVLLNPGAIHHIGPNRMWVELARRWAARGVSSVRVDLKALGDSDGDSEASRDPAARHAPETIDHLRIVLDTLESRGLGSSFMLVGLCSGAYWSIQGALNDERVKSAVTLNPAILIWDPAIRHMRDLRMSLRTPALWLRALRGDLSFKRLLTVVRWSPNALLTLWRRRLARKDGVDDIEALLDRLRDSQKQIVLAFSEDEPLHDELTRGGYLKRLERWPNVQLEPTLPGEDHTLRSGVAQRAAHETLDRALPQMLERDEAARGGDIHNSAI
jgi:hypothetical protein